MSPGRPILAIKAFTLGSNSPLLAQKNGREAMFGTIEPVMAGSAAAQVSNTFPCFYGDICSQPLKPGTTYEVRLRGQDMEEAGQYASAEPFPEFTTKGTSAPLIPTLNPVTDFTATTAHITGIIDPNAPAEALNDEARDAYRTQWHIECEPACKDKNGNVMQGVVEAGEGPQPIAGDAIRLAPNTTYDAKLVATNGLGTVETPLVPFTTTLIKPSVKGTEGASDGKGGYTIQGVVNPNNSAVTTCKFEWGPTAPDYAFSVPCSPMPAGRNEIQRVFMFGPGNGSGNVAINEGQFRLSFRGDTTSDLPYNASPAEVKAALVALSGIGPTDVEVAICCGQHNNQEYEVTFVGALAEADVPQVKAQDGTVLLGSFGDITGSGCKGSVAPGCGAIESATTRDGGNFKPVVVEAHLTGLTPGAVYHFNLIAKNAAGEVSSGDQEFVPTLDPVVSCPNEQFRKENSSLALPECRAYELVTPMGKEGFSAKLNTYDGGEGVAFVSEATNLVKSGQGSGTTNYYVARRAADGWETIPNLNGSSGNLYDAPTNLNYGGPGFTAYSKDLLTSVWGLNKQDKPDDTPFRQYLRNPDGTFTAIGVTRGAFSDYGAVFALSDDLTHLVIWDRTVWGSGVYEYVGTGMDQPRRVDLDNANTPVSSCTDPQLNNAVGLSVSNDGSRIVNYVFGGCGGADPPADELWARVNGTTAVEVSASHCTRAAPACNDPSNPTFVSATPDGSRVFFTSHQQLVNGDTDQTNDIYACDIPSGNPGPTAEKGNPCASLRQISDAQPEAEVESVGVTAANGGTVLFVAKGDLASNEDAFGEKAVSGDHNLYVWHADASHPDGQTALWAGWTPTTSMRALDRRRRRPPMAATWSSHSDPARRYGHRHHSRRLSPRRRFGWADPRFDEHFWRCGQRRRLSRPGGSAFRNTIRRQPSPTTAARSSSPRRSPFRQQTAMLNPMLSLDALPGVPHLHWLFRIRAETASKRCGRKTGGIRAVLSPSIAIDGSGKDIYIETLQALTPADGDSSVDVYDVRVGGGFSFAEAPPCRGEECQPEPKPAPPRPAPGSAVPGPPNPTPPKPCPKGKVRKGKKCVKKKPKSTPVRGTTGRKPLISREVESEHHPESRSNTSTAMKESHRMPSLPKVFRNVANRLGLRRRRPRTSPLAAGLVAVVIGMVLPGLANAGDLEFEYFHDLTLDEKEVPYTQAGGHPFENVTGFAIENTPVTLNGSYVTPPLGFLANPAAASRCPLLKIRNDDLIDVSVCPPLLASVSLRSESTSLVRGTMAAQVPGGLSTTWSPNAATQHSLGSNFSGLISQRCSRPSCCRALNRMDSRLAAQTFPMRV